MKTRPFRHLLAPLKAFALWMVGGFAFLQSLLTVIAWWQGALTDPGLLDIFWLGMAPVMAYLYLRHVSIFGRKQPACLLPQDVQPKTGTGKDGQRRPDKRVQSGKYRRFDRYASQYGVSPKASRSRSMNTRTFCDKCRRLG